MSYIGGRIVFTPRKARKGFTLLELLIVIGILGVLIAILLPAIGKVREFDRRVTCQSNLRHIGVGLFAYAAREGTFPYPASVVDGKTFGAPWTSMGLHPPSAQYTRFCMLGQLYAAADVADAHIFYCPSAPPDVPDPLTYQNRWRHATPPGDPNGWSDSSYSYRIFGANDFGNGSGSAKPYRPSAAAVGRTAILCDIQVMNLIDRNHHGGSNVWYADGSARWVVHAMPPTDDASVNDHGPPDQWSYPDPPTNPEYDEGWAIQPVKAWAFFDTH